DGIKPHVLLQAWNDPGDMEYCGNWTPDGKYFVFESTKNGISSLWALHEKTGVFRNPNREPVQLTNGPMSLGNPVPSKDGKKLFASGGIPRGQLVHFDSKAGEFVPYLSGISAHELSFSKDGRWVAYTTFPEKTLWRCRSDGTNCLQLTFSSEYVFL